MAYTVTAGYVTVQTRLDKGRAYVDIPRGARLPEDVPAEEVDWLLRSKQIAHADAAEPEDAGEDPDLSGESDELDGLDKDALLEVAGNEGVEVDKRWGEKKLVAAIRDARQ